MGAKLTQEEVIERFNAKHGVGRYDYSKVVFERTNDKVIIICPMDNHGEFKQTVNDHFEGKGCKECSKIRKPRISHDEIIDRFIGVHGVGKYDYSRLNYSGMKNHVTIGCMVDKHPDFKQLPEVHGRGAGCPICSNTIVSEFNSIRTKRPDLVKFLKNTEDADTHSYMGNRSIYVKCPECGWEKDKTTPNKLSIYGFSCKVCSDGISRNERYMSEILRDLNVDFEPQKGFRWSGLKRYDFWIPSNNLILELDGIQHATGWNKDENDLAKQIANDKNKKEMALTNGVVNYLNIDCSSCDFDFLKTNFIEALSTYYNLSNIDFDNIKERSQRSLLLGVCDYWMVRDKENDHVDLIALKFGVSRNTIISYLKIGASIGRCDYDPKEERIKGNLKSQLKAKEKALPVFQYTMDGEFIKEWYSAPEVEKALGYRKESITACASGSKKSSYGYRWDRNKMDNLGEYKKELSNKEVYQYNKNGDFIAKWESVTDAISNTGVKNISNVALGKVKSGLAGGFRWSYEKIYNEEMEQTLII